MIDLHCSPPKGHKVTNMHSALPPWLGRDEIRRLLKRRWHLPGLPTVSQTYAMGWARIL